MSRSILLFILVIIPFLAGAQKNVLPVSATGLLKIALPEGSKRDKRIISVAAATSLLKMSTEYKGVTFSPVEVYSLPPVGSGGMDFGQMKELLNGAGYQVSADPADNQLIWVGGTSGTYLVYYAAEAGGCELYLGRSSADPLAARKTSVVPPGPRKDTDQDVVVDLDGNRYTILKFGNRFWLKENLRTTRYNDTTAIATGLDAVAWKSTKAGAFAVYDQNPLNKERYGLLYNGYAAASGKLCPKGWHVATDKDWLELEQLTGIPVSELERTGERGTIAGKLKANQGWQASAHAADNSSGFSMVPAGVRLDNGEYANLNQYANYWTSTVYDDRYGLLYLWNHHVHYNSNAMGRIYTMATNGYSVRCVSDSDKLVIQEKIQQKESVPGKIKPTDNQSGDNHGFDQRLIGKWNRSGAVHPHYADAASWGSAGYTKCRYEFKPGGTYTYTERSFRMMYPYIIIIKESGRFSVSNNQLTIVPENSVVESYSKKNNVDELGALAKSEMRTPEVTTYTFTFHYFQGIQEWNLVLQASNQTMRDGNFSSNDTFPNAWYFDQKYTGNELTSLTGN